jgi:hypothetical protein
MRDVVLASFLNPESILDKGGLALLASIIFAETGLLIGFFLPGDSLLFVGGFLASDAGGHRLPILPVVALVAFAAAVIGDQVGFWFGRKVGPSLFSRPDSRFFKQQNVTKAHAFRAARGQDHRAGPIRAHRAHVRPDRGRGQRHELPHVRDLQRDRRVHLGHRPDHARLLHGPDRRGEEQHRDRHRDDHRPVAHPRRHRVPQAPREAKRGSRTPSPTSRSEGGRPVGGGVPAGGAQHPVHGEGARAPQVGVVAVASAAPWSRRRAARRTAPVWERAAGPTTSIGPPATSITAWASPAWT